MNPKVDAFLVDGCGRCALYKTPDCKVISWQLVIEALRAVALQTELVEDFKWSQPCYTLNNKNVLLISAFKEYAFISFLKGSLLKDPQEVLVAPGKNSQADRRLCFTTVTEVLAMEATIKAYIEEAITLEKQGAEVVYKSEPEPIPDELEAAFALDEDFRKAFYALTPGRQRGYIIYFSQAKQSKTRAARIEKWRPKIFAGEGMHDGYKSKR